MGGGEAASGFRSTARAPGKVILFGEHAINRGQPALAASVGLYATCRLAAAKGQGCSLRSDAEDARATQVSWDEIVVLGRDVDRCRAAEDYAAIRRLAAADFFAPAKYILAGALGGVLPEAARPGIEIAFRSEIPRSCGLGSGGAAFAALAHALTAWLDLPPDRERLADWAHRGDVIAHGGIASRLDTQTALGGGVIQFTARGTGLGEPVPYAPGLCLVAGNTNVVAATSEVNAGVRAWLGASPVVRQRYFEAIGMLSRAALDPLRTGDWAQLGHLMTLNQVLLEEIGVSCPEIDRLIEAALEAGAFGAKLSGSGGGGIVIALTTPERAERVGQAIIEAGGQALTPCLGVPGAGLIE